MYTYKDDNKIFQQFKYNCMFVESAQSIIPTGYYICNNAENLGHILNTLFKYKGLLVVDGGVLELTHNADSNLATLMLTLLHHNYIRNYSNLKHLNGKNLKASILSKQQLSKYINNLK